MWFPFQTPFLGGKVADLLGFWDVLGRECWISQFHLHPLSTSLDMTSRTTRLSTMWGQPTLSPSLANLGLKELTDAIECTERCWTYFVLPRQNPRKNNKGRGKKTGHVDREWQGLCLPREVGTVNIEIIATRLWQGHTQDELVFFPT